ncbi:MAG: ComEA family DNA-binding protein [Saccharospirillum sp.]
MKQLITALTLVVTLLLPTAFAQEAGTDATQTEAVTVFVNINTDGAEQLADLLTGVGEARAQAIIDYRTENGPFEQIEDLLNVPGIGPATLANNEERIRL